MSKKIVIIDYQLGNLFSVNQSLINIGLNTTISSDPADIADADAIVLPGVGAFADAIANMNSLGLAEPIKEYINSGKPFLGICLGLQMLFTESAEFGNTKGLDVVKGTVNRFPAEEIDGKNLKVPQIAWNSIYKPEGRSWEGTPLAEIAEGEDFYFVHSFYVKPEDSSVALTQTTYGSTTYVSSIQKNNIFACQFHPEKSAQEGLKIYKQWAQINNLI